LSILFELEKGLGFKAPTPIPTPTETQSQKKIIAFNIKQQKVVFLELIYKEKKEHAVYVNSGRVMAIVNI
jgi:hypothetical protein